MQSVSRYSTTQKLSWLRLIFLLLVLVASVAHAHPVAKRREKPRNLPPARFFFVNNEDEPVSKPLVSKFLVSKLLKHKDKMAAVESETEAYQVQVRHVWTDVKGSLPLVSSRKPPEFNGETNFFCPNLLFEKNTYQLSFMRIGTYYYGWMAYGTDGKHGARIYASFMEVDDDEVKEAVRLTGKSDVEKKQWSFFHANFWSNMDVMKGKKFVAAPEKKWLPLIDAPEKISKSKISFMTVQGNDQSLPDKVTQETVTQDTKDMKDKVKTVLHIMHGSSRYPLTPPPLSWSDAPFFRHWTSDEAHGMALIRLDRVVEGYFEAFGWIAHGRNKESWCGSIMVKDRDTIREVARVMNAEDKEVWTKLNAHFLEKVEFFGPPGSTTFEHAPVKAWSKFPVSDKDAAKRKASPPSGEGAVVAKKPRQDGKM